MYLNYLALILFSSLKLVLFTNFAMLSRFKPNPSSRHDETLFK